MIKINVDVGEWLEETGWPTYDSDMEQLLFLYHDWIMTSPRKHNPFYSLDADILIDKTIRRMKHIHPNPRDADVISSLLILRMAQLARFEGVIAPELTNLIH
ncbi:hypothetical protein [Alkalimarinus alittae]|uniref:Uncharacterized protein n=1 Tax=Alkalimarinus alittae TaxID=2961619 RepID=A0ABY6N4L1_9ALTE|nr:hypothetical protein [Alkalimarinus alittae]UZE96945.1 hypothetical protein NKI27_04115 [Alkalimarinus alittae]